MLLIIQRALVGLEIEKRWSDGVSWSPCRDSHWRQLVRTYYMTVGFLQLSVSKLMLGSAGVCTKQMLFPCLNMAERVSSGLKMTHKSSKYFVMFEENPKHQPGRAKTMYLKKRKKCTQHKSCWICLSAVGMWPHIAYLMLKQAQRSEKSDRNPPADFLNFSTEE